MAVDRNAVREGTRWVYDGLDVVVLQLIEVEHDGTYVVFREPMVLQPKLASLSMFRRNARGSLSADHERFQEMVGRAPQAWTGDDLNALLAYLLDRVGAPEVGTAKPRANYP